MEERLTGIFRKRSSRHIAFWLSWVIGFTFIKSFGESVGYYMGWFSYYILTLPIFICHTYFIVYVLIPYFWSWKRMPLFIVLFAISFYGFSVLELIFSNEFIYRWFQTGIRPVDHYLDPGNVIKNGLGNFYIVLVFLAVRTIRNLYIADKHKQELQREELKRQLEDTLDRVQPHMLLFAIDHIDQLAAQASEAVSRAIALTSGILSEVMLYTSKPDQLFAREIEMIRKLIELNAIFRNKDPEVEFFITGDLSHIHMPPMILFTFMDIMFRKHDGKIYLPGLNIEVNGLSNMISIEILTENEKGAPAEVEECIRILEQMQVLYASRIAISFEPHVYGCSVMIRERETDPELDSQVA